MNNMGREIYVKQFVAGFFIPAAGLVLLLVILSLFSFGNFFMSWDLLLSPIFLGLYNIFYFKIKNIYPIKNPKVRYGLHGAVLFVISSLAYTFIHLSFNIHPEQAKLLGSTLNFWWHITPVFYWPLMFYVIFAYLQKPFSEILGLKV